MAQVEASFLLVVCRAHYLSPMMGAIAAYVLRVALGRRRRVPTAPVPSSVLPGLLLRPMMDATPAYARPVVSALRLRALSVHVSARAMG